MASTPNTSANDGNPDTPDPAHGQGPDSNAPRRYTSEELFAGMREIAIDHNGRRYQLRITQTGKLILTA